MKKPQIHVSVDFTTARRLEEEATRRGVSVSELARQLIERGMQSKTAYTDRQ
jgi:hypothetical protein